MLEAPGSVNISALRAAPALRNLIGSTASDACRTAYAMPRFPPRPPDAPLSLTSIKACRLCKMTFWERYGHELEAIVRNLSALLVLVGILWFGASADQCPLGSLADIAAAS